MNEKDFSKDDFLLLAKMSQQTERYSEMIDYIKKFLSKQS